jgi:hypothetical protein
MLCSGSTPAGFSGLVADRYEVEEPIGSGGMAYVYAATDRAFTGRFGLSPTAGVLIPAGILLGYTILGGFPGRDEWRRFGDHSYAFLSDFLRCVPLASAARGRASSSIAALAKSDLGG